ncbi:DNA replication factor Cdt1-like isoform X2 [Rhopilema esculentum]|uniref:DNA replication factor Cdt1-like isoform X2 n=1 Tax=Rhopilema esculentum TaxID=499914 RepID=UPI0031DE1621
MTEQTTVTGFFPIVKSNKSNFASHPAKRRKVELLSVNSNLMMKQVDVSMQGRTRKARCSNKRTKSQNQELSLSKLLSAEPVKTASETTSSADGHQKPKRKNTSNLMDKKSQILDSTVNDSQSEELTNSVAVEQHSNVKVDPWISEQAKLVLAMGRGSKAVQASQGKNEKTTSKSVKPSEVFKPGSEEVVNKGNVREMCLQKFQETIKAEKAVSGKGRLRQKFSHLISSAADDPKSNIAVSTRHEKESISSTRSARLPAHQRYKHLTTKKPETTFVLPQKYKSLLEMFRSVDSVLFLLYRRSETCTFERLKTSVQSMLGKKFMEKHLGQMKAVYPKGFTFRIEKKLRDLQGMPSKPQLTIDANFEELVVSKAQERKDINQTVLILRRNKFESALVEITKKHHQKYLKKLNLKIDDNDLQRWHPHFKLEDVPDIEEASLPEFSFAKPITSVKDMLESNNCIPQVAKAFENVSKHSKKEKSEQSTSDPLQHSKVEKNKVARKEIDNDPNHILKGVSSDLLERIREKEMKKAELAMLRDPAQERRLVLLNQLPDIVRTLKTHFTIEKKAAIPLEDCSIKFSESMGLSSSSTNFEDQIKLLHELVPDWLSIVIVRKCPYVKIAKSADVNNVLTRLKVIEEKERKK